MKLHRYIQYLLTGVLLSITGSVAYSQQDTSGIPMPELGPYDTIPVPAEAYNGVYIPSGTLEWHFVTGKLPRSSRKRNREWTRLRNAVYVTWPYAKKAGVVMNEINANLDSVEDKKLRKDIIATREDELKEEFAEPLQELSVYQGKVLMKLINRQTGNNCYELVKEYKGGVNARFWQTIAFVFGSSLKQPYNPVSGQDKDIEEIVMEIERMYW